jgi:hypothetical protein
MNETTSPKSKTKGVRDFVKVRGRDAYRPNPILKGVARAAHEYRLKQAEQLLRDCGYREVWTPVGPKWEKPEDDARDGSSRKK